MMIAACEQHIATCRINGPGERLEHSIPAVPNLLAANPRSPLLLVYC